MKKERKSFFHRFLNIVGIVIGCMLLPILIINIILIIEGYIAPEKVPDLFGITPMIVVTDSMNPAIKAEDMIVGEKVEPEEIRVGDIISFFDPLKEGNTSVITHRVIEVRTDRNGDLCFKTQGDANNQPDAVAIPANKLVCRYRFTIPYVGKMALFLRTAPGFICFALLPFLLFVLFEILSWKKEKEEQKLALQTLEEKCQLLEDSQNKITL